MNVFIEFGEDRSRRTKSAAGSTLRKSTCRSRSRAGFRPNACGDRAECRSLNVAERLLGATALVAHAPTFALLSGTTTLQRRRSNAQDPHWIWNSNKNPILTRPPFVLK